MIGSDVGKLFPIPSQQISCDPVTVFVHSCPLRLNLRRQLAFFSSFSSAFQNIVIFLSSQNLAPEFHFLYLLRHAKPFDGLENDVGCLFAEANSCFFKNFSLFDEIGKVSARARLSWLFFSSNVGLVQEAFEFFRVVDELIKFLVSKVIGVLLALLDILRVVLKELVAISIVIEDDLLEYLN